MTRWGVEGGVTGKMRQRRLEQFGAYQKARQLFDVVVADMEMLTDRLDAAGSQESKMRDAAPSL